MTRATIMRTTAFRRHLMDGKRFYEGYIYQTNRKTYMVYTPEYRCWIGKDGRCWAYALVPSPKTHQNPWGNKIQPTQVKPPPHVDVLKLRERIMSDLGVVDLPSDRQTPGKRSKKAAPQDPRTVIEAIHQAAQKTGDGPKVLQPGEWPAEPPGGLTQTVGDAVQHTMEDPPVERAPADGYENTQDYDVLRLITDLWSRCGGSQEDLEWARTRFTEIGFLLPEVETELVVLRPGTVSYDELVADLEGLGYRVQPS